MNQNKPPHAKKAVTALLLSSLHLKLLYVLLALLVRNRAAGLAGGLAGCLAFAAAHAGLLQASGLDGLNMLHSKNPPDINANFCRFFNYTRLLSSLQEPLPSFPRLRKTVCP
jgi:hypothetical protein